MKIIKELELGLKDLTSFLINRILKQPSREIPDSINRILFFRYDVLGDMILSRPVAKVAAGIDKLIKKLSI